MNQNKNQMNQRNPNMNQKNEINQEKRIKEKEASQNLCILNENQMELFSYTLR